MNNPISVAVVDEFPIYRAGIVLSLRTRKKFVLVGQGETAKDAIELCAKLNPRILLLNSNIPGDGLLDAIKNIKDNHDNIRVVILANSENMPAISTVLAAGADGYLMKNICMTALVDAMYSVDSEQTYVDPRLTARQLTKIKYMDANGGQPAPPELSPREEQVLEKVAAGLTNKEIARHLELSDKTVKHYLSNIMQKLNVRNRVEATIHARTRFGMAK